MDLDMHNIYDGIFYCARCGAPQYYKNIHRCECGFYGLISNFDFDFRKLEERTI